MMRSLARGLVAVLAICAIVCLLLAVPDHAKAQSNGEVDVVGIESQPDITHARQFVYQGDNGWWRTDGGYSLAYVADRVVTGDFDGNQPSGIKDDVAVFFDYGSGKARIHVFLSTGSGLAYQGDGGWWATGGGYSLAYVAGRMAAGDFNADGRDDIAVFFDYGSGKARIHVFLSTGSSLTYQGDNGWWATGSGYSLTYVGDRMVTGDFNGDGRDDIAVMFDYGGANARIHVFLSNGTSFVYQGDSGWWARGSYLMSSVLGRMVAGDFDGNGRDDIATLYDYTAGMARIHVFLSTGSSFTYQGNNGWWRTESGYSLASVADRMIASDFDADGRDDVAVFFDYGSGKARIHVFLSTGSSLTYQGDNGWWATGSGYSLAYVGDRMVPGDFNADGADDVAVFFDYGSGKARIHVFLSAGVGRAFLPVVKR